MYVPQHPKLLQTTLLMDAHRTPVVSVFGEIDLSTNDTLGDALLAALLKAESGCLIVDLRGVEFMDVTGVHSLLAAQENLRLLATGGELLVVCNERILWLIETLGLEEDLRVCLDLPEAHDLVKDLCLR